MRVQWCVITVSFDGFLRSHVSFQTACVSLSLSLVDSDLAPLLLFLKLVSIFLTELITTTAEIAADVKT